MSPSTSFNQASQASPTSRTKRKYPPPFSLRLTSQERAILEERAKGRSLGAYIRMRLLGEDASPRKFQTRRPATDSAAVARALALLGESRIASNLNQIAKAANLGVLPVTPDLEAELQQACSDVRAMRTALIAALGIDPVGSP